MLLYVNTCCKTRRQHGQTSRYLRLLCSNCLALHVKVLSEAIYILCASRRDFDKTMSSSCMSAPRQRADGQLHQCMCRCSPAPLCSATPATIFRVPINRCFSLVKAYHANGSRYYICMYAIAKLRTATPCQKKNSEIFNR